MACYDWRTTPYADVGTDGAHLARARQLVEQAYANSGGLPVYLLGHSNGPLYALALLRTMTVEWRAKYVGEQAWPCIWGHTRDDSSCLKEDPWPCRRLQCGACSGWSSARLPTVHVCGQNFQDHCRSISNVQNASIMPRQEPAAGCSCMAAAAVAVCRNHLLGLGRC